ncbi:MAG: shikimate kinase [Candidatus Marinimicrobia bacterium]|nr:shikimate kinase [Candidatus Neomarinimicrobiota bacterium]
MNYFLIGMMGCGKTTVGKLLAKNIEYNFIDLDLEIEKFANMKINDIFENHGEEYFRTLEIEVSRKLIKYSSNNIIATGGGFPINKQNMNWMEENGNVIWLKANSETIYARIKNDTNRPLLNSPSIQAIKKILNKRIEKYKIAKHHIDTNGKSLAQIVEEIKAKF